MARNDEPGVPRQKGPKAATGGKWSTYRRELAQRRVSWEDVDPALVARLVVEVCGSGAAVLFGTTSDGGSFALTVCDGSDRLKIYAPDGGEMEDEITRLLEHGTGKPARRID